MAGESDDVVDGFRALLAEVEEEQQAQERGFLTDVAKKMAKKKFTDTVHGKFSGLLGGIFGGDGKEKADKSISEEGGGNAPTGNIKKLSAGLAMMPSFKQFGAKLPELLHACLADFTPNEIKELLPMLVYPDHGKKFVSTALLKGWCMQHVGAEVPARPVLEVFEKANSGDVVLVAGQGAFSAIIRHGTQSHYSHCGVLLRNPSEKMWTKYGQLRDGTPVPRDRGVYLLDSDFEEDGSVDGVTLRPFETQLRDYMEEDYHGPDVDVIVRSVAVDDAERARVHEALEDAALEYQGRLYESKDAKHDPLHFIALALSVCDGNKKEDFERFFCSELLAACYQRIGWLPLGSRGGQLACNYVPQDFATPHGRPRAKEFPDINTVLTSGASLQSEVRLDLSAFKTRTDPWRPGGDATAASDDYKIYYPSNEARNDEQEVSKAADMPDNPEKEKKTKKDKGEKKEKGAKKEKKDKGGKKEKKAKQRSISASSSSSSSD